MPCLLFGPAAPKPERWELKCTLWRDEEGASEEPGFGLNGENPTDLWALAKDGLKHLPGAVPAVSPSHPALQELQDMQQASRLQLLLDIQTQLTLRLRSHRCHQLPGCRLEAALTHSAPRASPLHWVV